MHKFIINQLPSVDKPEHPVLYKVHFGRMYYIHKGKVLYDSLNRFLEDVFRGMRGKSCSEHYSNVVEHCLKYPAIHRVSVELCLNLDADKVLKKEILLLKAGEKDQLCLNRADLEPYKPEWMVKVGLQKRCENCLKTAVIDGRKTSFKFCPNCGRLNKIKK